MWELAGARAAGVSVCVHMCVCACACVCSVWALECLYVPVKVCHYVFMELLGGRGFSMGMACLAVHMHVCEPPPCPIKAEAGGPCSHCGVIALGTFGVGGRGELCVLRPGGWRGSLGRCTRAYLPTFLAHQARGVGGQQWDVFGRRLRPLGHSGKQ